MNQLTTLNVNSQIQMFPKPKHTTNSRYWLKTFISSLMVTVFLPSVIISGASIVEEQVNPLLCLVVLQKYFDVPTKEMHIQIQQ